MEVIERRLAVNPIPVTDVPVGISFYVMNSERPDEVDTRWLNLRIGFNPGMYVGTGTTEPGSEAHKEYIDVVDLRDSKLYRIHKSRKCVLVNAKVIVDEGSSRRG